MRGVGARRTAIVALLLAGVVVLVAVVRSRPSHELSLVVPAATNLIKSQRISDGAKNIGAVTDVAPVDRGRAARVTLRIDDADYWPLKASTKIEIRLGGTVSYSNRYLYLRPGGAGPAIRDGGTRAGANVKTPF